MRALLGRPLVRRTMTALVVVAIAVFAVKLVARVLQTLGDSGVEPQWSAMLWSIPVLGLSRVAELEGWFRLVVRHGQRRLVAARVCAVGELFRYLPGGVVHLGARYKLGRGAGLGSAQAVTATGVDLALRLAVALASFVVSIPFWTDLPRPYVWASVALLPLLIVGASPPVVRRAVAVVQRRTGGEPVDLPYRVLAEAIGWFAAASLLRGAGLWVTLGAVVPLQPGTLVAVTGVAALAWAAGVVVPFSPGGLGVREAVGIAVLAPWVGVGVATLAMLVNRLAWIAAEFLVAAAVEGWYRLRATGRAPAPASTPAA